MLVQTKEIEMKPEDVERIFQSEDYKAAAEKGLFVSSFVMLLKYDPFNFAFERFSNECPKTNTQVLSPSIYL